MLFSFGFEKHGNDIAKPLSVIECSLKSAGLYGCFTLFNWKVFRLLVKGLLPDL